jgi:hypothetical protein
MKPLGVAIYVGSAILTLGGLLATTRATRNRIYVLLFLASVVLLFAVDLAAARVPTPPVSVLTQRVPYVDAWDAGKTAAVETFRERLRMVFFIAVCLASLALLPLRSNKRSGDRVV